MAQRIIETPGGDEGRPQTEAEAEAMQAESDRLMDRIEARLKREGDTPENYERILHEELARRRRERGEPELTPEEEAERAQWIDALNRAAEEALANPDPELAAELNHRHPLYLRAYEISLRLYREIQDRESIPATAHREHPLIELVHGTSCAAAKLASALNGYHWPPPVQECAGIIVRLKRARGFFDDALLGAEACAEQKLLETPCLDEVQRELQILAQGIDALIAELRERLARGFA